MVVHKGPHLPVAMVPPWPFTRVPFCDENDGQNQGGTLSDGVDYKTQGWTICDENDGQTTYSLLLRIAYIYSIIMFSLTLHVAYYYV